MWQKIIVMLLVLLTGTVLPVSGQMSSKKELKTLQIVLHIIEPKNEDLVPEQPYVKGTVVDPNTKVWVIIHPMEVSDYWVQQRVNVKEDGTWRVQVHIGKPGFIDVGKQFEIMAVANPKVKLKEGDVLDEWPEAEGNSQLIVVTRK